jgi:hypothetical protein
LKSLFRDDQRKIVNLIMQSAVQEAEKEYQQLYEYHAPMIHLLKEMRIPAPKVISIAAEVTINAGLRRAFEDEKFNPESIKALLKEAQDSGVDLDTNTLEFAFRQTVEQMAERLVDDPSDLSLLKRLEATAGLIGSLPFRVNLWKTQNIFYEIAQNVYPAMRHKAGEGSKKAIDWLEHFRQLGSRLNIRVAQTKPS